jgi:hypothetical protein
VTNDACLEGFVDGYLLKKAEAARVQDVGRDQTVAPLDDPAAPVGITFGVYNGRSTFRCSSPRAWWSQARRVLANAHLLWPPGGDKRRRGTDGQTASRARLKDNQASDRPDNPDEPAKAEPRGAIDPRKRAEAASELTFSPKGCEGEEGAVGHRERRNNHDLDVDDLVVSEASVSRTSS